MNEREACDIVPAPRRSLHVGIHAYECLPGLVFVLVPNERGRYMLVDRCVAEVDCPACGSIAGEPCHNRKRVRQYWVGTHCSRRDAWQSIKRDRPKDKPKLRLRVDDVAGALGEPAE